MDMTMRFDRGQDNPTGERELTPGSRAARFVFSFFAFGRNFATHLGLSSHIQHLALLQDTDMRSS